MSELAGRNPERFDWIIYRNATLAGLAVLIPIPLLDWLFEELFRRGMPGSIARRQKVRLSPDVIRTINRVNGSIMSSCLALPFRLLVELVKRISRKLLYFLTIKEASDKIYLYWHQAYLINHMLAQGHLEDPASAWMARQAMEAVIKNRPVSPMHRLALDIVQGSQHILRTLLKARRGQEDEQLERQKNKLVRTWSDFAGDLRSLAGEYDQLYTQLQTAHPGQLPQPPGSV